jgi:hypothetical protein
MDGLVLLTVATVVGTTLIRDTREGHPSIKPVVTGFMLGGVLGIVVMINSRVGHALCVAGIVGAVIRNGSSALGTLNAVSSSAPQHIPTVAGQIAPAPPVPPSGSRTA